MIDRIASMPMKRNDLSETFEWLTGKKAHVTCSGYMRGPEGDNRLLVAETPRRRLSLRFQVPDVIFGNDAAAEALAAAMKRLAMLFPFKRPRIPLPTDRLAPRLLRRPVRIKAKRMQKVAFEWVCDMDYWVDQKILATWKPGKACTGCPISADEGWDANDECVGPNREKQS